MPDEITKRRFLRIEQVAEELATSEIQCRAMLKAGQLKGILIGGRNLWRIGGRSGGQACGAHPAQLWGGKPAATDRPQTDLKIRKRPAKSIPAD